MTSLPQAPVDDDASPVVALVVEDSAAATEDAVVATSGHGTGVLDILPGRTTTTRPRDHGGPPMALYFVRFDVHQPDDMSNTQLNEIWNREASG